MCRKSVLIISFVLLLSLAGNVANADISDGLLVWHDFEDLVDGSGNGHDAVLGGNAYISDGLLNLDGSEDYADIGTPAGFGPVNPLVDGLSDFTIAVAYACTSTAEDDGGSILVSVGPAAASGSGDFSLGTSNDGQLIDHWWTAAVGSDQSGIGYANGTVHLVVVTYEQATDTYTFYHIDAGAAVDHGGGEMEDWSGEWDASLDYGIRLGSPRNATLREDEGPGFFPDLDGQIDMFAIWDRALDTSEMAEIVGHVAGTPEVARNPNPADEEEDVPLDAVLSWTPGKYASKHDVYFGTNFDDVNDATRTVDPNNVYQARQDVTGYPVFGTLDLDYGKTYYWRIDEANTPPDPTIYKGNVWSFTAEPCAYPIDVNNITATASSYQEGSEPNNTINGSGLDDDDQHSIVEADMWLSEDGGSQPTWIQYEFDKAYNLYQMWIWNHNTFFEPYLGFGSRDVKIEYSTNGTNWTQLEGVPEFDQAPGKSNYTHSTTIDFNGAVAQYVKLTVNSSYSPLGSEIYGLSEVRLLYIPLRATRPNPDDEQEAVAPDTVLSWKAGREAATHEVYIDTDEQAVTDGTIAPITSTEATYGPLSLDLDTTYYWKVVEVNNAEDPNVWESEVWSFTTNDFLTVDDMESYGLAAIIGQPGGYVWYTWKDGEGWTLPQPSYDGNGSGSASDLSNDPAFGGQSLACYYDNDGTTNYTVTSNKKYYSEITARA